MWPIWCAPKHAALIDPRDFLRRTALRGPALPFVGLARTAAAEQAGLVARRIFFDNPDYSNVRVSPDGQQLAYLAPVDGDRNLWVASVADPAAARPVTRATGRKLGNYYPWAHPNRHLVFSQHGHVDENGR